MDTPQIRFEDGAAYEDFMGVWSRLVGDDFLDWLAPEPGLRWADVGCGNGAFTEMLVERCGAAAVEGIDPAEAQLAFARTRPRLAGRSVRFTQGDAMALPWPDGSVDAAAMALVLFFVPDPAKGVAEMVRVTRPGGSVSAYSWDLLGGGFPYDAMSEEMAALGMPPLWPPSAESSRLDALRSLWSGAGMSDVSTLVITVERTYADFDTFWRIARTGPRVATRLAEMGAAAVATLEQRLRDRLAPDANGRITCSARANAAKGRVPTA